MKKIWGLSLAVLCAAACSPKASIDMTVDGAPETKLAVYRLNVSSSELLDSVKTDKNGKPRYYKSVDGKMKVISRQTCPRRMAERLKQR